MPTADENDALVGAYLAWCTRHRPGLVQLVGRPCEATEGQELREGMILHATGLGLDRPLDLPVTATKRKNAINRSIARPPAQAVLQVLRDVTDRDLLRAAPDRIVFTDTSHVHGKVRENTWLQPGRSDTCRAVEGEIEFSLRHNPVFPGGLGWTCAPTIPRLLERIGGTPAAHLSQAAPLTIRIRVVETNAASTVSLIPERCRT